MTPFSESTSSTDQRCELGKPVLFRSRVTEFAIGAFENDVEQTGESG